MTDQNIKLTARWDNKLVPADEQTDRSLLIEVTAPPKPEQRKQRAPINLALVIDRSGSMNGESIEAARKAAVGVAESLDAHDRLSIVIFDSEVDTLCKALQMNTGGRAEAIRLIKRIEARGTTDLGGGWFEGARCAAEVADDFEFVGGHVLVLSDGRANQGICEPLELTRHAAELADRGIKTSCVGIGADYSPLQLDALAEGGRGRLHDAETGADIVDVVLGELGELHAITAHDVELTLDYPNPARLEFLTRASMEHHAGRYTVRLGDIGAAANRPLAVKVELPRLAQGESLPFDIKVRWRRQAGAGERSIEQCSTVLQVVPPQEAAACSPDLYVVEHFADLWEATLAYRAMQLNERGDYQGALAMYDSAEEGFEAFSMCLNDAPERQERFQQSASKVSAQWEGRSKRQAFARAKKRMRREDDHRSNESGDWHDHL